MKRRKFLSTSLAASSVSLATTGFSFNRISADSPIAEGAKVEKIATGFTFSEGPACAPDGSIYICDFQVSEIHVIPPGGESRLFAKDTGGASGFYFTPDGRMIAAGSKARALLEFYPDGSHSTIVDNYGGKRFNAPNDLWIAPDGGIYFTDPNWGRHESELGGGKVFYLSADRKRLFPVVPDFNHPNGVVGDPIRKRLYVIKREEMQTYWFPILPDGALGDKVFFAGSGRDGLTVDTEGNVYITAEDVYIFDKRGRPAGIVQVPERPSNCCFAGEDMKTLIITAGESVYAVKIK